MRRTWTAAFSCAAVVAVAGCSTTQTGHGFGPVFTTVSDLAAQATKAGNDITSVRGTLRVKSGPLDQTSTFSELQSRGRVTAFDDRISTIYQGKTTLLHLVIVDGKVYVERSGQGGKPWVVATRDSSDPVLANLAENVDGTLDQAGMHGYVLMVSVGQNMRLVGPDTVDGVPCVRYHLSVDARVAAQRLTGPQAEQMQQAVDAGVDTIPLDVWVDAIGRTVRVTDHVTAGAQSATVDLRMSHFNEPVSIHAPPPDQIAPG
ncbi:MAG TPA: hypothetical protein VGJ38_17595 [Jatrophihabitantaceae bacterium]|jgi:hypothetical protein